MSVASKNYNFYVKNASIIFGFFLDHDDEQKTHLLEACRKIMCHLIGKMEERDQEYSHRQSRYVSRGNLHPVMEVDVYVKEDAVV